jgi:phosphoribosylanthranilate isomerase
VPLVGVFVNAPAAGIEEVAGRVGLGFVQFSGDEEPEAVAPFAGWAIKAFRTGGLPGREEIAAYGPVWGVRGFLHRARQLRDFGRAYASRR